MTGRYYVSKFLGEIQLFYLPEICCISSNNTTKTFTNWNGVNFE